MDTLYKKEGDVGLDMIVECFLELAQVHALERRLTSRKLSFSSIKLLAKIEINVSGTKKVYTTGTNLVTRAIRGNHLRLHFLKKRWKL